MNRVADRQSEKRDRILALIAIAIVAAVAIALWMTSGEKPTNESATASSVPQQEEPKPRTEPQQAELKVAEDSTPAAAVPVEVPKEEKVVEKPKAEKTTPKVAKTEEKPKAEKPKKATTEEVDEKDVVIIADENAQPQHGYEKYYKYIKSNLHYPAEAKKQGAEGVVSVEFVVKKDGRLANVKIKRGIGYGCDEEAIRVIREGDHWKPASDKGQPVMQKVTIPIHFKLN